MSNVIISDVKNWRRCINLSDFIAHNLLMVLNGVALLSFCYYYYY